MTYKTRLVQIYRAMLRCLCVALFALSTIGTHVNSSSIESHKTDITILQTESSETGPVMVIACSDSGGSGGSCGDSESD